MQQDSYFYPVPSSFTQDASLQFQNSNSYHMQPGVVPWSTNYVPDINSYPTSDACNSVERSNMNCGDLPQPNPLVTPVSTAVYGTTSTFSWAHTVPSLMPWVTKGEATIPDPVVRFTAPFPPDPCTSQTATSWELLNNLGANKTTVNMHLKRKSDLDVLDEAPQKMCITEERMAARLKELHISNQYSVPLENSAFGPYGDSSNHSVPEKSVTNLQQLEAMLKDSESGTDIASKSLVLAPELKKLVEPDKIFASTFLNKVERPSMAVVLWQPQNNMIVGLNNNISESGEEEKKESHDITIPPKLNCGFLPHQFRNHDVSIPLAGQGSTEANSDDVMDT